MSRQKKTTEPAAEPTPPLRLEWRSPAELAENPRNWRVHNEAQEAALVDVMKLDELLREIDTGSEALQEMLAGLAEDNGLYIGDDEPEPVDAEPQVDRAEELQKEWGTATGQLWLIDGKAGTHRVLCGDSTKADDVAMVLDGCKPLLMVTDPPYGVEYDADWRNHAFRADGSTSDGRAIGKVSNDDRADWREAWALFSGDVAYVWHGERQCVDLAKQLQDSGFESRNLIAWAKSGMVIGRGHYHSQHETCWYVVRKNATAKWAGDHSQTTLWEINKPQKSDTGHSTQKPLECMARPIRNHDAPEVYDPFLGSGTTLIAAENLSRVCYGIEISPAYTAVILQRCKDAGMSPRLSGEGAPQS